MIFKKNSYLISNWRMILLLIIGFVWIGNSGCKNKDLSKVEKNQRKVLELRIIFQIDLYKESEFRGISSVCMDNHQTIHVIDSTSGGYLRLSRDGKVLKKIHKKGEGPGEWTNPNWMQILDQNKLAISDVMKRKILFFDLDLNYLNQILLPRYPLKFYIHENDIYIMTDAIEGKGSRYYCHKILKQNVLEPEKLVDLFTGNPLDLGELQKSLDCDNPGLINFDYSPKYDKIIAIKQVASEYTFFIIDPINKKKEKVVKPWTPIPYNEKEKQKQLEKIYLSLKMTNPAYDKNKLKLKDKISTNNVAVDSYGNIWVSSVEGNSSKIPIDIFSPDGHIYSKVVIDDFFKLGMSFFKDYVVFYELEPDKKLILSLCQFKFKNAR